MSFLGLIAAVAVVFWSGGAIVGQDLAFLVRHVTFDDSYYYLNTAWNARHLGWVTFDGHHPTNGVQFLWFWLLWGCAWLCETKIEFLRVALWLCVCLGAASVVVAWRVGAWLRGGGGGVLAAALVAHAVFDVVFLRALENTLHLFVFLAVIDQYLRLLRGMDSGDARAHWRLVWLFALLSLNVWTRLDSGAISAVVGVHAAAATFRSAHATGRSRALACAAFVCVLAGCLQLFGNWLMGGSALPVSGLWKTGGISLAQAPSAFLEWWGRPLGEVAPLSQLFPEATVHVS